MFLFCLKRGGEFECQKIKDGITLVALVISIIVLIILAGVSINMIFGENGIFSKTQTATNKYDVEEAKEKVELKKLEILAKCISEENKTADLQDLADGFCADDEVEYVKLGNKIAQLPPVDVTGYSSILVKLKAYVYEFEIGDTYEVKLSENLDKGDNRIKLEVTDINGDYIRVKTSFTEIDENDVESYDYYEGETLILQNGEKENAVLHLGELNEDYTIKVVLNLKNGEKVESKFTDFTTGTRTYILKDGNQFDYITNGFSFNTLQSHSVSTSTDNNEYYMYASSQYGIGYGQIEFYTNDLIDISNYTKLYIDMDYSVTWGQADWRVHFYYGLQKNLIDVPGTNSSSGTTIELNVNDTSDRVYFQCYSASAGCPSWARIKQIYFE